VERTIEPIGPIPMLRQRVLEALEQLIIDGTLAPGEHLVETDLAARLGVSRGPVREALHSLNRDGWVELRPRQGAFVRHPTDDEVDQFFQVRSLLEGECARLAALRADAGAHDRLRALLVAGWAAVDSDDERTLVEANTALHGAIVDLAGNATLQELTHLLRKRSQWFFSPVSKTRAQTAWKEHEGVVDAIIAGDGHLAAERLRGHIEGTRRVYKTVVPPQS
jgi:DNA-binding GntR family transcriptional regulator